MGGRDFSELAHLFGCPSRNAPEIEAVLRAALVIWIPILLILKSIEKRVEFIVITEVFDRDWGATTSLRVLHDVEVAAPPLRCKLIPRHKSNVNSKNGRCQAKKDH